LKIVTAALPMISGFLKIIETASELVTFLIAFVSIPVQGHRVLNATSS